MRLVLDSMVFVEGVRVDGVTVPSVVDEILEERTRLFFDTHRPEVRAPDEFFVDKAREAADSTGDLPVLSGADLEVLGLALELRDEGEEPVIVTDDYAVQNVASVLGVEFRPVEQRGIEEVLEWQWFCPGCGRVFGEVEEMETCPVCGSDLKRRRSN
ncbi:MAG: Endoribonuclease Nob1 [Methanonatronarchaeales archaeon]|nr:Endoribonuclease Nob1 [Methanonatronarchaeales archaeon]